MTIVILGAARFLITSLESDSSELYGALNQIAVSVISAEHSSASEVQNAFLHYEDIIGSHHSESFNPLGLILKDVSLVKPEFSNSDEKKAYQEEFRHSVQSIRQRNYEVLQALFSLTYVLVGIMILVFLFGFLMFRFLNRDLISFIRILSENLSSLTERMNYGKVSALEIGDSAPLELRELGLKIRTIEEGIVLDQFLDNIDSLGSLKEVLEKLAHTVENLIPFDRIALAFNDLEGKITAETAFTRYEKIYLEPGYSEELNNTSLKGIIQIREGRIINDLPLYAETHSISKSTKLILHEGIKASLTIPMFLEGRCRGFLFFSSREKSCYTQSHLKTARRLANRLKNTFFHEYISQELIAETAQSFVELMNAKDNETSAHLTRMSHYSYIIARSLSRDDFSVSPGFPREILWFAPLHDIGKIAVPDSILMKEGKLTHEEFEIMKSHVQSGLNIIRKMNNRMVAISNNSSLKIAEDIISGHHEKFNGFGYPHGLSGRDIPLAGRIVAIADVFDALTSKRSYKEAFSFEKAIQIMSHEMKGSFDPVLFGHFMDSMDEIRVIQGQHRD